MNKDDFNPVNIMIGKKIKHLRMDNDLTQQEFAQKYNYSKAAVRAWESGRSAVKIEVLQKICNDFGYDIQDLIGRDEANQYLESKMTVETDDLYEQGSPFISYLESIGYEVVIAPQSAGKTFEQIQYSYQIHKEGDEVACYNQAGWTEFQDKIQKIMNLIIEL